MGRAVNMSLSAMFSKSRIGYIGLDFSDTTIEAVQFEGVPGGKFYKVIGWSRLMIPPGIILNGKIQKSEELVELVRKLFARPKQGSLDSKNIILSVPEHQCYHFQFEKKSGVQSALYQEIQKEAIGQIPFQLSELLWDWDRMTEANGKSYYYGAAVPKDVIAEYQKVLKQLGLRIMVAEPQVHSAARFYWQHLPSEEPTLYIDIGGEETMVATVDDLGVHQSSVVSQGTLLWYQEVAKLLKTPLPKAAQVVRTIGLRKIKHPKAAAIHKLLDTGLTEIQKEASQHLSYFSMKEHPNNKILKNMIVSGGGGVIPGIGEYLAQKLSLTLAHIEPWAQFKPEIQPATLVELSHAIGAAMRGVYTSDAGAQGLNVLKTKKVLTQKHKRWWGGK